MTNEHILIDAAKIIQDGGVVAFPTETVYGLGANALNENAVTKIFEIKRRPFFDPLIVHVSQIEKIDELVTNIPALAKKLANEFLPGPLTLVLPKKNIVPDIVTAGLKGVAVRVPKNKIARRLIELANVPIAAPSANLFGAVSPTTAAHVREQLGAHVDMLIDGGACTVGVESSIVSFVSGAPVLLRPGGVPLEEIENCIGKISVAPRVENDSLSPGRCENHYAPAKPLVLINNICEIDAGINSVGLLTFGALDKKSLSANITHVENLSESENLNEAACNLFAAIRRLDAAGVSQIAALPIPNAGLGLAINDRLYRASRK